MRKQHPSYLTKVLLICCLWFFCSHVLRAQSVTCLLQMSADPVICIDDCSQVTNTSFATPGDTTCFQDYYWVTTGSPSTYTGFSPGCVSFSSTGTQTITVYAVDSQGTIHWNNFVTAQVMVVGPLDPSFTFSPDSACVGDLVSFSTVDPNIQPFDYVYWDFGDGNFGNGTTAVNQYVNAGSYTVTCYVGNECDTTFSTQVIVVDDGNPHFTWAGQCKILFSSDTTCDDLIISHSWNFGDPFSGPNNTSPLANPSHIFTQNGVPYIVTHTIVTQSGTETYTTTVIQQGAPPANIIGYQVNNCGNGFITYTANPCTSGLVYTWTVSGGSPISATGCSIDINWGGQGGFVYLAVWDSVSDCIGYDTLEIPPCCHGPGLRIDNMTASQALSHPLILPFVTGNTITYGGDIFITGVFTVDVPIAFANCPLINMGANTPVNINSGQTLTLTTCTTETKCGYMWDGIYIADASATLNITGGSVIQQARNAVVSNNGGNYFIQASTLQNNYKDMIINGYIGTHPGVVRNTDFTMNGTFLPAFPALPFGHNETVCGIEINSNANITIGDETQIGYRNRFTNILVGVRSTGSIAKIVNARFDNFVPTLQQQFTVPNAGTAIVAVGGRGFFFQPALTVGGITGFARCAFNDTRIGIDTYESITLSITSNNFTKTRLYAMRVQRSQQRTMTISNNFITNQTASFGFANAILMLECYQSTVAITVNTIRQAIAVPNQNGIGIRVALVTPGDMILDVVGNTIDRVKTGIWTQRLIGKNHVSIVNNTINFQKANALYTTTHYGIRVEACATVRVRYNTVTKTTVPAPTAAMVNNLRGISIENSPTSIVAHNTLNKMGTGIFGWELCSGSSLACNALNSCYDGFFFAGGAATGFTCDIGDQLLDPNNGNAAPTGNTWSSINVDIAGAISPTINWYRDAYVPSVAMAPLSLSGGNTPIFSANPSGCSIVQFITPSPGTPAVEREQNAGQPILNPSAYAPGSEQGYQGRRIGHRALRETPSWLSLGTPQDSLYSGFYLLNENSNIGLFRNFEDMAAVDSVQAAGNILTSITGTNISETNLKVVYSIYQQTWMQGVYEFSSADSAVLYTIATQHASDAGEAVYAARVMLDLQVDEYATSSQRLAQESGSEEDPQAIALYPNPASTTVNGSIILSEGEQAVVTITDVQGKTVLTQSVANSGLFALDVSMLEAGLYFVQTAINGELIETSKLEILHE